MRLPTESRLPVAAPLLGLAALLALALALPGRTVVSVYVNDLMIFLDGAHRLAWGQAPSRDFHAALGPLVYAVPAAGYLATGSLGAAMPVGMALVTALLAPVIVRILGSRLHPLLALPFGAFLLVVLAVPMNLGEAVSALSFAMFYNRVGWVALALLLTMYLQPRRPVRGGEVADAACAALLVLVLAYSKVSYGAVAGSFLLLLLLDPARRRLALWALGMSAAGGVVAEIAWRGSLAHLADLALAARVSGGRGAADLADSLMRNLADYVLFALAAGLALTRTRSARDLAFYLFCAAAGLALVVQNSQAWGILTLHAGAAVALETLLRCPPLVAGDHAWRPATGAPLLLLALTLPTIVHCAAALGLHAYLAARGPTDGYGLPRFAGIEAASPWPVNDEAFVTAYRAALEDGAAALERLGAGAGRPVERVFVLDFANPFSAGLGLKPPRGDHSWQHWGRNLDQAHHVAPERVLADVAVVMEPKPGINGPPLAALYGPALRGDFVLADETSHWRIYVRAPGTGAVSQAGPGTIR